MIVSHWYARAAVWAARWWRTRALLTLVTWATLGPSDQTVARLGPPKRGCHETRTGALRPPRAPDPMGCRWRARARALRALRRRHVPELHGAPKAEVPDGGRAAGMSRRLASRSHPPDVVHGRDDRRAHEPASTGAASHDAGPCIAGATAARHRPPDGNRRQGETLSPSSAMHDRDVTRP